MTEQIYCRWRKGYSGMRKDQARRLKQLKKGNARLKKLVADLPFDSTVFQENGKTVFKWIALENKKDLVVYKRAM